MVRTSACCVLLQFYDSLKEAAQLAARPAATQSRSPSLSSDAMLPTAAAVEPEPSAAAAQATAKQGKQEAAVTVSAAGAAGGDAHTDAAGRQPKADMTAQQVRATAEPDKQEQPPSTKGSCVVSLEQQHQAAAEARKVTLAGASARLRAKKVAAKRANAEAAEAAKAEPASADRNQATQPAEAGSAKAKQADTKAQEPHSAHAEKSQAKSPAATKAVKKVEAQDRDLVRDQRSQVQQAEPQADRPQAARADAPAERDHLGATRMVSEADGQHSNASAAGRTPSVTAAAAAPSDGQQGPADKANMAVGAHTAAGPVSASRSHLPLVSVEDNGRVCRVVAGEICQCMTWQRCLAFVCGCVV